MQNQSQGDQSQPAGACFASCQLQITTAFSADAVEEPEFGQNRALLDADAREGQELEQSLSMVWRRLTNHSSLLFSSQGMLCYDVHRDLND